MTKWTDEQLDAINNKHEDYKNIIVSAGAGSGKTAVLKERVIEIIKRGVSINNLLILTFTNDAAHEMKDRIREAISENPSLKGELDYIDSSYISTFDSFSLSIVKKYSYLLNIGNNIDIADESIIILEKKRIIDEIFDRLYKEKDIRFLKLINDLTLKKDDDIKLNIINISDLLDLKYDKKEYLDNYIEEYFSDDNINSLIDDYTNVIIDLFDDINDVLDELSNMVDIDYFNDLKASLEPLLTSKDYESIRSSINTIKIPSISKAKDALEEAKETKEKISDINKEIKNLVLYDRNELKEMVLSTKDYVSIIIDIIKELDEKLWKVKTEMNMFDFSDISKMGIKILKENESVREELKNYFYEIIIDEYQDTSDLQEEFISLISNNNVYVVGDIKQSIYKFRNANPDLFKVKYNNYSKEINGHKIDLTKNFRSREEVVNDINLIFSHIMTESIGDADYKKSHQMVAGNDDYKDIAKTSQNNSLEIINYNNENYKNYSKEEIEAFYIAQDIKEKLDNKYMVYDKKKRNLRKANYGDFTIILDRKSPFELYKKIFQYFQIPLSIKTANNIVLEDEIVLIKNILKLLICHKDKNYDVDFKYAFTSIARSYLFEMNDQEIFDIITSEKYSSKLMDTIDSIVVNIDSLSLNDILNEIINKFDFYYKFILVGDVDSRINRITSIIKIFDNLSKINYSINDAYEYLCNVIEDKHKIEVETDNSVSNSVKIINTHKSKGLEYPICYYASMHKEFNKQELNDKLLYSKKYGIITPYFNEGVGSTFVKEIYKRERKIEDISERIRLFYVALTRAREKMIIVTSFPEKETHSIKKCKSILDFLNYSKDIIRSKIRNYDIDNLGLSKDYNSIKKDNYKNKIEPSDDKLLIKELNIENELLTKEKISKETHTLLGKEVKEKMKFGTKIHEALELLDFNNPDYSMLDIDSFYIEKIKKFINKIDIKNVINIYKEYEFLYEKEDNIYHGVIDLILEYNDSIKIIDYKLKNVDDPNYIKQLNSYRDYISTKTNKKIDIYLFSIIDGSLNKI